MKRNDVLFTDKELDVIGECLKIAAGTLRENIATLKVRNPAAVCAASIRSLLAHALRLRKVIERR